MALPAPNATWKTKPVTSSSSSPFRKQFTQKELEEKRDKNQCFYYDQRELLTEIEELIQYSPHISLNAINGTNTYQTIRICGHVGKYKLHILVDCGSTHNFLDLSTAKKLGCQLISTSPMQVEITGGSNILTNFKEFRMEFKYNGKEVLLRESQQVPKKITELLHHYSDVFAIPTTLPPKRPFDHKIWHPPNQKDPIKVMVKELLDTRDNFPIPIIEERIDELQGSRYFTKLDLRSSYHQIRMHPNDVQKTSFKTHEGHYEFLIMLFGLTNAPSSFQALMNSVFKAYLRRFVLVFFDDILVYSPTLETHVRHLELVLQVLRQNTLYAKQSKCVFKTEKVEYLGHVITRKGVATDKSKIEAMQNWPVPTNLKQLRTFLGRTGYYRRFVKSYAIISHPLTQLLKRMILNGL
nr:hypothetical protein [Tanacetum cinerariifolium]